MFKPDNKPKFIFFLHKNDTTFFKSKNDIKKCPCKFFFIFFAKILNLDRFALRLSYNASVYTQSKHQQSNNTRISVKNVNKLVVLSYLSVNVKAMNDRKNRRKRIILILIEKKLMSNISLYFYREFTSIY